jgi:Helix-loop-helix DNA-binding domain
MLARNSATSKAIANRAHAEVERRYREGLKVGLDELEAALSHAQRAQAGQEEGSCYEHDEEGLRPSLSKRKKFDLLHDTVEYIHQSEVDTRHLSDEVDRLNDRVRFLEKLVKCEDCPLVKQMNILRLRGI